VRDAQLDDAFKGRMSIVEQKVHTMMAAPLQTKDRIIGLIYLDSPFVLREFTKDDLSLLTVMANVRPSASKTRAWRKWSRRSASMARDLSQAAEIQGRMLPEKAPEVPGADLAGFNMACRTVGRRLLRLLHLPRRPRGAGLGRRFGQGHARLADDDGAAGARSCAGRGSRQPGAIHDAHQQATCAKCPSNRFITFFFSVLNAATGELAYANAGHNPPILMRANGDARCWRAAARCWASSHRPL